MGRATGCWFWGWLGVLIGDKGFGCSLEISKKVVCLSLVLLVVGVVGSLAASKNDCVLEVGLVVVGTWSVKLELHSFWLASLPE